MRNIELVGGITNPDKDLGRRRPFRAGKQGFIDKWLWRSIAFKHPRKRKKFKAVGDITLP